MTPLLNKHHALVSWAAVAGVMLTLLMLLATPLLEQHDRYRFELIKDGRTLQRLQSVAKGRNELETAAQQFQERGLAQWVFPANQEPDMVVLAIQKRVSEILTASKSNIRSIATVSAPTADGYNLAGVRVQFNSSLDALLETIREIESNRPLLVIDDLRMVPGVSRIAPNAPQPQTVEVVMTVVTYLPVSAETGAQQ